MEQLIGLLNGIHPLSTALQEHLALKIVPMTYPKRAFIQRIGRVSNHIYFIEKGLVRSFYMKEGQEICGWFMMEGDIIVPVQSFFQQVPSTEAIQTLEDTFAWGISYAELQEIYNIYPEFNRHGRIITETYYSLSEARNHMTRKQSAFERFGILYETSKDLLHRVSNRDLASYLGINECTLSRIKAQFF